jgi:hypothetical protein
MSQSAILAKPIAQAPSCDEITPSLEQIICIHPHAEKATHVYYFDAVISHKDHIEHRQALVISP